MGHAVTVRGVATALVIALAVVAAMMAMRTAWSQDHHPHHRDFYRTWKQPGVTPPVSCCDARITREGIEVGDCEPTQAEMRAGAWWVWVRQIPGWVQVPDAKVLRERNPSGQDAHHCWTPIAGTLCFVPPDTGG